MRRDERNGASQDEEALLAQDLKFEFMEVCSAAFAGMQRIDTNA